MAQLVEWSLPAPSIETGHRQTLIYLYSVNRIEKAKIMKRRSGMVHFFKKYCLNVYFNLRTLSICGKIKQFNWMVHVTRLLLTNQSGKNLMWLGTENLSALFQHSTTLLLDLILARVPIQLNITHLHELDLAILWTNSPIQCNNIFSWLVREEPSPQREVSLYSWSPVWLV